MTNTINMVSKNYKGFVISYNSTPQPFIYYVVSKSGSRIDFVSIQAAKQTIGRSFNSPSNILNS